MTHAADDRRIGLGEQIIVPQD